MSQTIEITGLIPEQIEQVQKMRETFKTLNQQQKQDDRPLITDATSPLTHSQTRVKKYAKNRHLAEELIQERRHESMNNVLMDASAILAFFTQKSGSEPITNLIENATISTINLSEVIAKLVKSSEETGFLSPHPKTHVKDDRLISK